MSESSKYILKSALTPHASCQKFELKSDGCKCSLKGQN